ncbi:hypothetical protein DXG03_002257 [Asterophora parasitica]|uniref:F-box domain-containing protein n=1 Tax=Asterophora parasitica TaxID=117018 RepID=A0A9P7G356_9AGAR|nr:hypothetical protein DXG03_002257 [Asterophora parasitica]
MRCLGPLIRPSRDCRIHQGVFMALGVYRPVHNLLPNIRTFTQLILDDTHVYESVPYLQGLLGPTLTEVTMSLDFQPDTLRDFLSALGRLCPTISSLTLFGDVTPTTVNNVDNLVCNLHHLRRVDLPSPIESPVVIRHLGSLQSFQECGTRFNVAAIPRPHLRQLFNTEAGCFPQLDDIELQVSSWDQAGDILSVLQRPLAVLDIIVAHEAHRRQAPISSFGKLADAFIDHRCLTTLTGLYVAEEHSAKRAAEVAGGASAAVFLRELFVLRNLRDLYLRLDCVTGVDDSWIAEAAVAWPRLQAIRLDAETTLEPKVTLAGIIPLVKNCPDLDCFLLPISAKPFDIGLLDPGIRNTKITELSLAPSLISEPSRVFRCLIVMFPRLRLLECPGFDDTSEEGWQRVQTLVSESAG